MVTSDETYDPADHTVDEVLSYVDSNPDQTQDVLDLERSGKNRSTLVSQLEARMEPAEDDEFVGPEDEDQAEDQPKFAAYDEDQLPKGEPTPDAVSGTGPQSGEFDPSGPVVHEWVEPDVAPSAHGEGEPAITQPEE